MRLANYLNESVMWIAQRDLPNWVRPILKDHGYGKDVKIVVAEEADVPSKSFEYSVRTIYFYEKGKVGSVSGTGSIHPLDNKASAIAKNDFKVALNRDRMVLTIDTHPKLAELFVHPDAMGGILPAPNDSELSNEELLCLLITRALKSSYRREEAKRYGINYDKMVLSLKAKGLVTTNGAINKEGKNLLIDRVGNKDIFWLAKDLGMERR